MPIFNSNLEWRRKDAYIQAYTKLIRSIRERVVKPILNGNFVCAASSWWKSSSWREELRFSEFQFAKEFCNKPVKERSLSNSKSNPVQLKLTSVQNEEEQKKGGGSKEKEAQEGSEEKLQDESNLVGYIKTASGNFKMVYANQEQKMYIHPSSFIHFKVSDPLMLIGSVKTKNEKECPFSKYDKELSIHEMNMDSHYCEYIVSIYNKSKGILLKFNLKIIKKEATL